MLRQTRKLVKRSSAFRGGQPDVGVLDDASCLWFVVGLEGGLPPDDRSVPTTPTRSTRSGWSVA